MTKRTAAELLREMRAVRWQFCVTTPEGGFRCSCRRDVGGNEPVVSRGQQIAGGVAWGLLMCIPCATEAVQEHQRVVADLEWRQQAEEDARRGMVPKVGEVWRSEYGNEYTVTRVDGGDVVLEDGPHRIFEEVFMYGWAKVGEAPPLKAQGDLATESDLVARKKACAEGLSVTDRTITATVKVEGLPEFTTKVPAGPSVTVSPEQAWLDDIVRTVMMDGFWKHRDVDGLWWAGSYKTETRPDGKVSCHVVMRHETDREASALLTYPTTLADLGWTRQ